MQRNALRGWLSGIAVVLVLALSQEARDLAAAVGLPIPRLPIPYGGSILDNLLAVAIVLAGAALLLRRFAGVPRSLGLGFNGWRGPLLTALATLPCWIGLAVSGTLARDWSALDLALLAFAFPLAEEIAFRGFGFIFARRALGWPLGLAVAVQAIGFGLVHWIGSGGGEFSAMALQIFVITGLGGAIFALLDALDGYGIWSGWVLHASLNAAWTIFAVSENAASGWLGIGLRLGSAALALLLVWKFRRPARA